MDTFRKWLNKPKADDKSLLARFYHADRALTAVASELDSFDGRAEPDRCSRLVSRLRQGQDKVLSITNQIMEELLGDDRAPRAFRAKFPEEVLQENLAGQLWFGAECLAAGSSIMNRELESTAMRPLAKAVTKSLDNVRNLLRDQCLRNNIPNSPTLRLDINDSATEQLYESLKIFDRLFAEFELRYVSAMVQVKSKHEYEMQELICVLFSETLQRALNIGLLEQEQVDSYDPALMFSIPRLAIITGLVIYNKGPLNMDMPADQLSEMFRPFRTILIKIRDLLRTLNKNELFQLEKLLCTNEDIHLKSISKVSITTTTTATTTTKTNNEKINNCDDVNDDKSNNSDEELVSNNSNLIDNNNCMNNEVFNDAYSAPVDDIVSTTPSTFSTTSASSASSSPSTGTSSSTSSTASESSFDWTDEDSNNKDIKENLVTTDCASGYLIPNTNFGNLLQTNETLLTDNFVASDDEYDTDTGHNRYKNNDNNNVNIDSGISTENTCSSDQTPDSNNTGEINKNSCHRSSIQNHSDNKTTTNNVHSNNHVNSNDNSNTINLTKPSCSRMETTDSSEDSEQRTIKASKSTDSDLCESNVVMTTSNQNKHSHHHHHHQKLDKSSSSRSSKSSQRHHHHHHRHHSKKRSKHSNSSSNHSQSNETSSEDTSTSSSLSDGDPHEVTLALRAAGRMKFKSTENLLHRLFVCIAGVADQLQTNFASDLRQILRSVFLMNTTPIQNEIEISDKSKETTADLFEFRASENDVIQENAGSNQSIYSAEEVNPEIDNVFTTTESRTIRTITQRGHSLDNDVRTVRNNIGRSHSLGEDTHYNNENNINRNSTSFTTRDRHSSQDSNSGSNSPINSSASNSPISGRTTTTSAAAVSGTNNNNRRGERIITTTTTNTAVNTNSIVAVVSTIISTTTTTTTQSSQRSLSSSTSSPSTRQSPPAWIPDEEAPRCMACTIPFTAFRRRHHCRNCGGVFCGGCSNSSAPLPKYGLIKAVRVCRECYVREIGT